jgi:hypothetical protein
MGDRFIAGHDGLATHRRSGKDLHIHGYASLVGS